MITDSLAAESDNLEQTSTWGKRIVSLIAVVVVIGGILWWSNSKTAPAGVSPVGGLVIASTEATNTDPVPGKAAPDFTLTFEDGSEVHLSDMRGQPVLINFWATWCGPCRAEMPEIVRVANQYKEDGLVVLAMNVQEGPEAIEPFAKAFNMEMPIGLDTRGRVVDAYKVRAMPSTFFVNKEGVIEVRWEGLLTGSMLDEHLAKVLN